MRPQGCKSIWLGQSVLNVIARMSAFQFKGVSVDIREVAQRLGADLVIEGSVRKAGIPLRITAQAIHSESGHMGMA